MTQITTVSAPSITSGNYYFLKGRFKSSAINLYGIFLVVFNPQKIMESHNAVVSTFSNLFDFEPHIEWAVFEDKITEIRWKGNCNANMTTAIINIFETINKEPRLRDEMYGMISSYNYSQIEVLLFDQFNRIIRDKNTLLETSIQEATLEDVTQMRETRAKKVHDDKAPKQETAPSYDFEVEEGSKYVSRHGQMMIEFERLRVEDIRPKIARILRRKLPDLPDLDGVKHGPEYYARHYAKESGMKQ